MKHALRLKHIPAAVLILIGGAQMAQAQLVSAVCNVNDVNACESPNSTLASASLLTIRGYTFDIAKGDRPVDGSGAYVMLRNEDTLASYRLPIQRIEARPDVVAPALTKTITAAQYPIVNAGFIAQVFMASLPQGRYSVQEVRINMKVAGLVKLPLDDASSRATFNIGNNGQSPFRLVKPDGASVPLSMGKATSGTIPATGYPSLRDGAYKIEVAMPSASGVVEQSVDFSYRRPVVAVPVSLPIAEGFPGMTARIAPTNPLTNRALDVEKMPVVVDEVQAGTVALNGETLAAGKTMDILRQASVAGIYPVALKDEGDTEQQQVTKLWVDLPDAPNIQLVSTRWNPATKIKVSASQATAAIKVQELDVQAKLDGGSADSCQTLTTIRPEYMLSQTAGVTCAIQYGELLTGMKYNPYASNALRGSVPVVGTNTIAYTPGVVYTDPATKKTAFYPAKNGAGSVNIQGTTPEAIVLTFKNDKLLDTIYAKNSEQYPGKSFAMVDRAQPRSLGVMNVTGAYRGITTRVTYPGTADPKEVNSSLTNSNVALIYQADTPWAEYPVKVESWYQNAPEFKTVQTLDFLGVPMTPLVDLEKAFVSHDQADTIIRGQVGISKGQVLVFDAASMGNWQVFIREEKSDVAMGVPVAVGADGMFTVNLGRLSAGTRYIVAEAKMVDVDGATSNSSAISKSRALVTALGETIEATLAVRAMSGKAPFVQTISANVKNTKLLANVKAVSWERKKEDGTWERIMRSDTVEQTGVNYTATVADVGTETYRAVLVNKFSGAEYVTEPLTLQAFALPTFRVIVPGVVQTQKPVTLTVEADEGLDAVYSWRMITSGGYEGEGTGSGKSFTFTPTELKNYSIEVTGRSVDAPDNNLAANIKKTVGMKAVNPLAARATITGPTYVEAGKTYSYKARINDVVPSTSEKTYTVKGYWSLPDGTRVDGTELEFTPRTGDTTLSFYTYVDGYPEETAVAVHAYKAWTYVWPTQWRIKLIPSMLDVPAALKYYVESPGFDLKTLNGEPLMYTWSLPQNVTRSSGTDVAGTLAVSAHGSYQVAVQISDTRGNVVDVTSDEFTILPPASVQTRASIISKYGETYYAPGTYYISLKIDQMPRGDSFLRNEVHINGNKVGEFTGSGNYVEFAEPGAYDVAVRTITKAGNYGEQRLNVDVAAAPVPTCDIRQSTTTSGILITPACSVAAGYIKSLTWTYKLNGVEQRATSKSFLVAKKWITESSISDLTLQIDTDLGAQKIEPITMN